MSGRTVCPLGNVHSSIQEGNVLLFRGLYLLLIGKCSNIMSFQKLDEVHQFSTVLYMKETTRYNNTACSQSVSCI
jgi:hypothetical protein